MPAIAYITLIDSQVLLIAKFHEGVALGSSILLTKHYLTADPNRTTLIIIFKCIFELFVSHIEGVCIIIYQPDNP